MITDKLSRIANAVFGYDRAEVNYRLERDRLINRMFQYLGIRGIMVAEAAEKCSNRKLAALCDYAAEGRVVLIRGEFVVTAPTGLTRESE